MSLSGSRRRARRALLLLVFALLACGGRSLAPPPTAGIPLAEALRADWSDLDTRVVTRMPEGRTGGTAIVFLHGYGSFGRQHLPLARALAGEDDVRVYLPTAAIPHPKGGAMWWEFAPGDWPRPWSDDPSVDAWPGPSRQLPRAREAVLELVAQIRRAHRPDAVALAGHSQGAMLALDVALAAEPPVDRVAAASGTLLLDSVPAVTRERSARPRVLLAHGREDRLVPFDAALRAKALLEQSGFDVTLAPWDGGHRIASEVVPTLRRFLVPPPADGGGT